MSIAAIRESVIKAGLDASGYEAGARRIEAANQNMVASGERVAQQQEKLGRAKLNTASATERLAREIDRTYAAQQKFERAQATITGAMERGHLTTARGNELLLLAQQRYLGTAQATHQAAEATTRLGATAASAQGALSGMTGQLGAAGVALSALGPIGVAAAVAIAGIGTALVGIARAGDQASATLARLSAATGNIDAARAAYEGLYQISQRTGVAVADGAATFQRFRIAAGEIGATNQQVLQLVEGLQKAAVVSGAAGHEGAAAMMQLGQALASGRLNGDELRSLLENMPSLAQRLAQELGTNIGQLRKMGEEGQLTADKVFPALLRATGKMSADFDKMPLTMERAFNILGAAMKNFAEKLDEALGISQAIAAAAKAAADAVNNVRRATMPTAAEAADAMVADGERRMADAKARLKGAEAEIAQYQRQGLTRDQAIDLAVPSLPGTKSVAREMADAEAVLRRGLQAQSELRAAAAENDNAQSEAASRKATEATRARTAAALEEERLKNDKFAKAAKEHAERLKTINDAAAAGVTTWKDYATGGQTAFDPAAERLKAEREYQEELKKLRDAETRDADKAAAKTAREAEKEVRARDKVIDKLKVEQAARERMANAQGQGEAAVAALNHQLEYENALREAGIPITGRRTEAEEKAARVIRETIDATAAATAAEKAFIERRENTARELERVNREIESNARRISDDVATSIYEGMVEVRRGQNVLSWFGNLFKRIAVQAASTQIFLPITTAIVGAVPQLFGIASAGAGVAGAAGGSTSLLGELGSALGLTQLLGSGGISGALSGLSGSLFGTTSGFSGGVMGAAPVAGTSGLFGTFGATSLGGMLGGIGVGFGAGSLLNSLLGRKGAQATNGTIGSGLGAGAGALIGSFLGPGGTLIGGLLGGLAGGGLGGMFGPGESVKGYGYRLEAADDGLLRMGASFYNETGQAAFQEAAAGIAALNDWMGKFGITVGGASSVGGNKNGADYSNATAGSFAEGVSQLYYHSADAQLESVLAARGNRVANTEELQKLVEGFNAAKAAIAALTAEPVPEFTQQMTALTGTFDAALKQAREYGLAEDALTAARAKAVAELEAQRAEYLREAGVSLEVRRLRAEGRTLEADLAQQAEEARKQLASASADLDRWAVSAAEKAQLLVDLEQVQAAERARIIADYGQQAADALRQAGGTIRQYLDGLATGTAAGASPTDRLAAAQAAFTRDRTLAMGGDRDALGRITATADTLLAAGRDMYASGQGFQDIKAGIVSGLSGLPVVQSYDAMQAASLEAIQDAIENGTLNTAILGGNTVTIAGGTLSLGGVESALAALNATAAAMHASMYAIGEVTNKLIASVQAQGVQAEGSAYRIGAATNQILAELRVDAVNINATAVAQASYLAFLATAAIAANDNLAAGNRIAADAAGITNAGFAAMNSILVDSAAATVRATADVNTSLGTVHAAARDINVSLATVDASIAAMGAAIRSADTNATASLAAANRIAVDASAASVAGFAAQTRATVDVNTSLGTVHVAARDINASLGTVDASIYAAASAIRSADVNATASLAAANRIAADASAASTNSLAALNRITVDSSAAMVSTLSALLAEVRGLRSENAELRQEVVALRGAVREGAVLQAGETRTAGQAVAGGIEDLRRDVRNLDVAA
jgi:tape measure domain-containing protein